MNNKRLTVVISPLTFIYLLLALFFIWIVFQISWILISLAVAGIFAIALNPVVSSLEKKLHIKRGLAVAIVVISIVAVFALVLALVVPTIAAQAKTLSESWPKYKTTLEEFASHQAYTQYIYDRVVEQVNKNTATIASNATSISIGVAGGFFSFFTFFFFFILHVGWCR